jgi:hypothetical protein
MVTDEKVSVKSQPRVGAQPRTALGPEIDDLEPAEDWLFVVPKASDERPLLRCGEFGLKVANSEEPRIERTVRGRQVIVVVPGEGPGRQAAIDLADRLGPIADKVVEWVIHGWGSDETPDLASVDEKEDLATTLAIEKPWLYDPLAKDTVGDDVKDPIGDVDPAAFHGVLGQLVLKTQKDTEANPLFVLLHLLAFFGAAIGRGPHFIFSADRHALNLFVGVIGTSGRARKGTAAGVAKAIWRRVDKNFAENNIVNGLNSGAGLLYHLRDRSDKPGKNGKLIEDEGVRDKKRVFLEPELSSVLMQGHRESDPLLGYTRQFFDGERIIKSITKDPVTVTEGHVSIIGHCTPADLKAHLSSTDKANGTANRFLWDFGVRSKMLSRGGDVNALLDDMLGHQLKRLRDAVEFASGIGRVRFAPMVEDRWDKVYRRLDAIPPGPIGDLFVRAPSIVVRVASLFALSDMKGEVEDVHLDAALAIWEHSERSLRFMFPSDTDPAAEKLLEALKAHPGGLTKRQIFSVAFKGHIVADVLDPILLKLLSDRTIITKKVPSKGGRPPCLYLFNEW